MRLRECFASILLAASLAYAAGPVSPNAVFFPVEDGSFVGTNLGRWARYHATQIRFDSGLEVTFRDANRRTAIQGIEETSAAVHVMRGWSRVTHRTYAAIRYVGLYPGIDMECRFSKSGWKSDFLLAPGAGTSSIRMQYEGIGQVSIGQAGQLRITTSSGEMEERIPAIYQIDVDGTERARRGSYRMERDGSVGFEVPDLDPSMRTVIDPDLTYSSYWAGNRNETVTAVANGIDDSIFIAGWTESTNLPVASAEQSSHKGSTDGFVAKLSANGQTLLWATFLGGSGADRINAIAVDSSNRVVVAGSTSSSNFPLQTPIQSLIHGSIDGFITRLAANGATLDFSTYYGGAASDAVNGVAVDSTGVYAGGQTSSTDFPILNAAYATSGGSQDGFMVKLSAAGTSVVYSTYLGGTNDDSVNAVAVYQQQALAVGGTSSPNLPVINGSGPKGGMDAFMMRLSATGTTLTGSTYIGGSGGSSSQPEMAMAVQVTPSGEPVVGGITSSVDFTTVNAAQATFGRGGSDGFVAKFNSGFVGMQWSTYLGGSSYDAVYALAVRPSGQVIAAGMSSSANFPVLQPIQTVFGGYYDAFVTVYLPYGSLAFSTLWGGGGSDAALSIANGIVNTNAILFGGSTSSVNLPMAGGGYQASADPQSLNGFFAKFQVPGGSAHARDKVGIFRSGGWALDKTGDNIWNTGDVAFSLGVPGDIPIIGDWTGNGQFRVGIFRGGTWYVDINGDNQWTWGVDAYFYYGIPGDIPVVGDWNGSGRSKIGVYRNGTWFLDYDGSNSWTNNVDKIISWGGPGDIPVVGDWNGNGVTKIGLFKDGDWKLDQNGDFVYTTGVDAHYTLGQAGDKPIPFNLSGTSTQPMVWRSSNGAWLCLTGTLAYYGYPGDLPIAGPW